MPNSLWKSGPKKDSRCENSITGDRVWKKERRTLRTPCDDSAINKCKG